MNEAINTEISVQPIAAIFEMALKSEAPWKILAPYIHDEAIDPPTRAWMCHQVLLCKTGFFADVAILQECQKEILKCLVDELRYIRRAEKPPLHPPPSSTDGDKYKWFADVDGK